MKFTKRYQYKIKNTALNEFIEIQNKAKNFYQERVNVELSFFINDEFEVTEYDSYKTHDDYLRISKVNDKELLNLYEQFKNIVVGEILEADVKEIIIGEDYGKN